ncbi:hypothetical protein B0H14DRAFT_2597376 [Mycena olivaceomarginata]|nr:hypothetical protein B0H14DRAFT_2597376 [Mycena olivaceomarginata]
MGGSSRSAPVVWILAKVLDEDEWAANAGELFRLRCILPLLSTWIVVGMAMGWMDEEVVKEREPSARGRGERRGRTKIPGTLRGIGCTSARQGGECKTETENDCGGGAYVCSIANELPPPTNPSEGEVMGEHRQLYAPPCVLIRVSTWTGNDTHRSSVRLRVKQMCPPPPPQRIPLRTPSRRPRLYDEARHRRQDGGEEEEGRHVPALPSLPPLADAIHRCLRENHPRLPRCILALVLPWGPTRYYPRRPSDRAASAATRSRCVCIRLHRTLPFANRDDMTGPQRRAGASTRIAARTSTSFPPSVFAPPLWRTPRADFEDGAKEEKEGRRLSSRPGLHRTFHSVRPLDDVLPLEAEEEDGWCLCRTHERRTTTIRRRILSAKDTWDAEWFLSLTPRRCGREHGWSRNRGWVGAPPWLRHEHGYGLHLFPSARSNLSEYGWKRSSGNEPALRSTSPGTDACAV